MTINPDVYRRAMFLLGESYATLDYIHKHVELPDEIKEYINEQLNEVAIFTSHITEEENEY